MKTAIITGITGQDGSYLAELLLSKGYKVYGVVRRASTPNTSRIDHIKDRLELREGDLTDKASIQRIIFEAGPDEFYNLAAQSFVPVSWTNPELTAEATAIGVLKCLDAIRYYQEHSGKKVKFYQAGSSEQFGKVRAMPQNEDTPFYPRSPYGVAKVFGYEITRNYRESYDMFAVTGLLFNHESPRRGLEFVTRKITSTLARIKKGADELLEIGNLEAKRDWGFSGDYVKAMWLMLQQDKPKDYVIATGEQHSVREFIELSCKHAGLDITWRNEGVNEEGVDEKGKVIVKVSEKYFRPAEVDTLLGDASKAKKELNWAPETSFEGLVKMMVESDLK
ncbi:MAG: GDP-mannose 4,6-dehydratase [Candidatus Nanoarchaeia archaeon]|jgi:GDPmannose 4,6-dehydratase